MMIFFIIATVLLVVEAGGGYYLFHKGIERKKNLIKSPRAPFMPTLHRSTTLIPQAPKGTKGENLKRIQIRLPKRIMDSIKKAIELEKASGDYSFMSVSEVIRKALDWRLKNHTARLELQGPGEKKAYSIQLREVQYTVFMEFPNGARSEILTRIVATYLQSCGLY